MIGYLVNDKLAIRELAAWHLYQFLAPFEASKVPFYSPVARPEVRQKAYEMWQKLLPPGKLPQRPEMKKKPPGK